MKTKHIYMYMCVKCVKFVVKIKFRVLNINNINAAPL